MGVHEQFLRMCVGEYKRARGCVGVHQRVSRCLGVCKNRLEDAWSVHECVGHLQGREDVVTSLAQAVQFVNRSTFGVHALQL